MRGKKLKKSILRPDQIEEFNGRLKTMSEGDIRRLIVKLLILKVLKESFITQRIRGINMDKIMVYLSLGKNAAPLIQNKYGPIYMSDGIKDDRVDFNDQAPVREEY